MTKTKKALLWLTEGRPRKYMEADLGLTAEECRQLINHLRKSGYIEPAYQLTEKGHERSQFVPKTPPEVLAMQRKSQRRAYVEDRPNSPESIKRMVSTAKLSQPNSVFALGAMA